MNEIQLHIFKKGDTLNTISNKYDCPLETLYLLNPLLKFYPPNLGKVIYVKSQSVINKSIEIDNTKIEVILNEIKLLSINDFKSYINKFNDHQFFETQLFNKYKQLTETIFKNDSFIEVFSLQLENLHFLYHDFIDSLIEKDNAKIDTIQKSIQSKLIELTKLLDSNHIKYEISKASNFVEKQMLVIAKMINSNYLEVWKIIEQ